MHLGSGPAMVSAVLPPDPDAPGGEPAEILAETIHIPDGLRRIAHSHLWRQLSRVRRAARCSVCGCGPGPGEQDWWVYRGPYTGIYYLCPACRSVVRTLVQGG